jgi:hypothetical protein
VSVVLLQGVMCGSETSLVEPVTDGGVQECGTVSIASAMTSLGRMVQQGLGNRCVIMEAPRVEALCGTVEALMACLARAMQISSLEGLAV